MASMTLLLEVHIAFIFFLFLYCLIFKKTHDRYLRNWPVLGMVPGIALVVHHIFDFSVEVLEKTNLTFPFKGPWLMGLDMLVTVDPADIQYILSSNFSNYTKGADFIEIFDVYGGDILITSDYKAWKGLRKASQAMINHQGFQRLLISTTRSKLEDGLVPLFDHLAEKGTSVDLQDVFRRFAFDTTMVMVTGCDDPRSLSIEMPEVEFAKAYDEIEEGVMSRHIKPRFLWKLQNWMGVGKEKKIIEACATLDRVCAGYISSKRSQGINSQQLNEESVDILASHMKIDTTKYEILYPINDKFLRDTILGFILAGKDTISSALTWFFWLLSENPKVLMKIRTEIDTNIPRSSSGQERMTYDPKEYLNKLVYLHGALYETMRLYPPAPLERVSPLESDVLPSGHKVEANSMILILIYALGRMKAVWGEDALEFKPERWISDTGVLRNESSFKFLAFYAGPKACLGKHLAMIQMKSVVVEMLQNYDIKVVQGQTIEPSVGLLLTMKHGLKVTISKRCSSSD